ncbi:MAG: TIGR01777 family oxidoreductase [Pirellulales bacterium]
MKTHHYSRRVHLPVSAAEAYEWHARPGALERLMPPWEDARVVRRQGGVGQGGQVEVSLKIGPVRRTWLAEHQQEKPGRDFRDVQIRGPFAHFDHTHRFVPDGDNHCYLEDEIEYVLPGGAVGDAIVGGYVQSKLDRMFDYRHRITAGDLALHARYAERPRLNLLMSGATGLIGGALQSFLTTGGHQVKRLMRGKPSGEPGDYAWDPETGEIGAGGCDGIDSVVHLAGESIASGRWSEAKKARIRDSRVIVTRKLCERLATLDQPPKVFVCASAIGVYGDRGDELLDEESPPGNGFLPDVCREWEAAAQPAVDRGIRVVHVRFGIVLSPRGGALKQMLLPIKSGAGGPIGNGRQYWSWVALDDCLGAIHHVLQEESVVGPVNIVAPNAPTNRDFTRTLGKVLHRPTIAPLPGFVARLMLGEMADALLLASARVRPKRLEQTGYEFREPELGPALSHMLGKR